VKELVDELNQRAPLLKITRDDINNKVRIIKGQREEEERQEVSRAIPFHIIHDPSLSTNSELSVSVSSNEQNPLDMLASQAFRTFENTSQAQLLTAPNRCSYEGCGTPFHLVSEICTCCLRLVHQICQQFAVGQGIPSSMLLCLDCCATYGPGFDISMPYVTAADVEDVVVEEEEKEEEEEEEDEEEER
jgi:hypothetical protein